MREGKVFGSSALLIIACLLAFFAVIIFIVPSSAQGLALVLAAMGATGAVLFLWSRWSHHAGQGSDAGFRRHCTANDGLLGVCQTACRLCGASLAGVLVRDQTTRNLQSTGEWATLSQGGLGSVECPVSFCESDAPQLYEALESNEQRVLDVGAMRSVTGDAIGPEVRRMWAVPLDCCGRAEGLLLLGSNSTRLKPASARAFDHVADLAAWAVRLYRAQTSYAQALKGISRVCGIPNQIGPQAPLKEVRQALVEAAAAAFGTELAGIYTIDPCEAGIECESTNGVSADLQDAFLDLYGDIATNRDLHDAFCETDIAGKECENKDAQRVFADCGVTSLIACPVRSEVGVSGALVAFYTSPAQFSDDRRAAMEITAVAASSILSYACAMEQSGHLLDDLAGANQELSLQATTDGLTGLANHRTLQQTLAELCRASGSRKGQVFSLIMIDVDHFKIYNDTHGHREGDSALREIARLISSELRQRDLAARYGGEEFAAVLKGVTKETTFSIAERIRRRVADHQLRKGSLTVSVGLAEHPSDGSAPAEVIERADRALYHAKVTGRNRVVVWGSAGCSTGAGETSDQAGARRRVLVVVQVTEPTAAIVQEGLPADSYAVELCPSADQAAEILRTRSFDLALVDTNTNLSCDIKRVGVLASMRPDMPIVLLAPDPAVEFSRDALKHGASDVLPKPFTAAELPLVVERNIERRRLERKRLAEKSTTIMLQAIEALVAAIDAKDHFTAGHSQRVTSLALSISDELRLSNDDRYALELAAKLHDIGKLGLPDSALNKQSPFDDREWQAMRQHPALGSKIVGAIGELAYISAVIRHHHERLDGTGYPDGLRGDAIPFLSRIIAVADSYEAMTSERAHRGRSSPSEAIEELKARAGTHYSPEIVEILERILVESGDIRKPAEQEAA